MVNIRKIEANRRNSKLATKAKLKRRVTKECLNCGRKVELPPSVAKRGWKYCSWKCRIEYMVGDKAPNSGGGKWMRGESNPNYKNGTGYERRLRYKMAEVNQWRRRIFARDKYICQDCGIKPTKRNQLRAHHIKEWSKYPEERFKLSNGITVCKECHNRIHGGKN